MRWELLTNVPFTFSVLLLALNDWVLKGAFHNALTGKLSDFAGLYAFGLFVCALAPRHRTATLRLTAVAFVAWKSPLADPLIAGWNALSLWPVGRVVDYSDLLALPMLALAARYQAGRIPLAAPVWRYATIPVALVVFAATSRLPTAVPVQREYAFDIGREDLVILLDLVVASSEEWSGGGRAVGDSIGLTHQNRRNWFLAYVTVKGDTSRSTLRLLEFGVYDEELENPSRLLETFEHQLIDSLYHAARSDSIMTLVRLTERPLRAAPIMAKYRPDMMADSLVFGFQRMRWPEGDTSWVIVANLSGDTVGFSYCEVQRDRLVDGTWMPEGRAFSSCSSVPLELPPGDVWEVAAPDDWSRGIWRMRAYFHAGAGTAEVATDPIVIEPEPTGPAPAD